MKVPQTLFCNENSLKCLKIYSKLLNSKVWTIHKLLLQCLWFYIRNIAPIYAKTIGMCNNNPENLHNTA